MLPSRLFTVCHIVLVLAAAIPAAAAATPDACSAPRPMLPDGAERQVEGLPGEAHCYRLELTGAGLWHLNIASPGSARAVFEILDADRRRASLEDFERSAAERLTFAPAGTWLVRVRAQDPRRPLPAYRLASRFVEAARSEVAWKSEDNGELAPLSFLKSEDNGELEIEGEGSVADCRTLGAAAAFLKSEDNGELEIEGEGSVAGCGAFGAMASFLKSEDNGELEIEGEGVVAGCGAFGALKSEDNGELEIEGEGSVAGCLDRTAEFRQALCDAGDDHGDSLTCATPVRCQAQGELANGWGDDVDAFRFRVDGWQTVEIAACGATRGELLDAAGQRLDVAGGDGGFRLVRTLGPGAYFVTVAGESAGFYGLEIRALDR